MARKNGHNQTPSRRNYERIYITDLEIQIRLLGRCHMWEACWRGTEGEASGACWQACSQHELQCRISRTKPPRRRNKSPSPELSHTHRTEFSSFNLLTLLLPFRNSSLPWDPEIAGKKNPLPVTNLEAES